ncbi:FitA-like ribbon-helix-helix domain-containing protein [Arhodomonas sp. SL1]|uniref:FitA-like ribbon-helix-helix domain-containing protein n=1 Tax=Arhodomonas sp. SL1 TaxID=3425691 RepID=UPI003F8851EE
MRNLETPRGLYGGTITFRNLPEAGHNALKARAKRHNRSADAEGRAIFEGYALTRLGHRDRLPRPPIRPACLPYDAARGDMAIQPRYIE